MITLQFSANAINLINELANNIKSKDVTVGIHNASNKKYITINNIHNSYKLIVFINDDDIRFLSHNVDRDKYLAVETINNKGIECNIDIITTIIAVHDKSEDHISIDFVDHEHEFQVIQSHSTTAIQKYYSHFQIVSHTETKNEECILRIHINNYNISNILNTHYAIGNTTHTITENETYIKIHSENSIILTSTNGRCMIRTIMKCEPIKSAYKDYTVKIRIPFKIHAITATFDIEIYSYKTIIKSDKYILELPSSIEQSYLNNEYATADKATISIQAIKKICDFIKKMKLKGNSPVNIMLSCVENTILANIKDDIQNISINITQEEHNTHSSFCICRDILMMIYSLTKIMHDKNAIDISYDNEKTYGRVHIEHYNTNVFFVLNKQNYE